MTAFTAPIAARIWDMKYRLKDVDGTPLDATVEDSWRRVARALASVEANPAAWEGPFHDALRDFRFLPAGRILAGAGTGRAVTLFNCFVMGTIPDSLEGIFQALKEAALTMQQGGGIGYDFSTLRPRGAEVKGVAADASGPLSFMDVWDAMCRTIMSAGSRRGAMMATLRCDHPDIEDFVAAKSDPARLRMFNLSVLVTDAFMAAVEADGPWDLTFAGRVWRTVQARDLWHRIMRATYDYAEPGVIFIDRINAMNPIAYAETIAATNPCVTADTWVQTAAGARQVSELIGTPFTALVDGKGWESDAEGFFKTGTRPVLKLTTTCGRELTLTADHLVRNVARKTPRVLEKSWIEAGKLQAGDEIVIHDQRGAEWAGSASADQGYLLGLLVGAGVMKSDKTLLSVWSSNRTADGAIASNTVMARAEQAIRTMPHQADFAGRQEITGRNEFRMDTAALTEFAARFRVVQGDKTITTEIEREGSAFTAAFLRSLFDADGTVFGTQEKGVSVRLSQSNLSLLQAAQRMLGRLGINTTISQDRRGSGLKVLPDGKDGHKEFPIEAQHELVISGENIAVFADRIGFEDSNMATRLANLIGSYRRAVNRERFTVTVKSVEPAGVADVYDVQIPGINAFDANGLYVHNCGEQPLPPYGACLLGSINLARLVRAPFEAGAGIDAEELDALVRTAVRMMDNTIDASRFPLPQQQAEAQAKRRLGLGVTGLADALMMLGLRYGSAGAVAQTGEWMRAIARAAAFASADLAREKGAFPLFDADAYLASGFMAAMDDDVREAVRANGIRNALLTSVAPTGTISLYAGNVSSGIEPVFAPSYTRKVLQPDGARTEEEVVDHAVALWRARGEAAPLPPAFVDAQSLEPAAHVAMQAAAQRWVDSSISKTINVPADIPFDAFEDVYRAAYAQGCKGCTTYRPNEVTGSVLSVASGADAAPEADRGTEAVYLSEPLDRPAALEGATYKVKWPGSAHAIYITVNDVVVDGHRRPFEVFINSKNMEHYAWTVALTRMISAVFRRGGDVSFVVEELKAVFDPRGGAWMGGAYVPSILAAIGGVIERHMIAIGFLAGEGQGLKADPTAGQGGSAPEAASTLAHAMAQGDRPAGPACPVCGEAGMLAMEGCLTCPACGHSECG